MKKITLVSSVAFVCGALFGWQMCRYIYEKSFRAEHEILENTIRALKKEATRAHDLQKDVVVDENGNEPEHRVVPMNTNEEMKSSIDISALKKSYGSIIQNERYTSYGDNEEVFSPTNSGIEVISEEEFFNSSVNHEVVELAYWALDRTLSDDQDEMLDNEEAIVGSDWVNHFGEAPDDPDVVYVRNHKLKTDFEILRKDESFAEVVLGIIREE